MSTGIQSSLLNFGRSASILYFSIIILLFGVFITAIYKLENYAILQQERSFNDQQLLQAQITQRSFQNSLDNIRRFAVEFVSGNDKRNLYGKVDVNSLELEVAHSLAYQPSILGVSLFNKGQENIFSTLETAEDGKALTGIINQWVSQNWIALNSPEIDMIVPNFYVKQDTQLFAILVPLRSTKGFEGAFVTLVDLKYLSEQYIAPMRSGQHGAAYMLNESGLVLYDHENEIIGRNVNDGLHKNYPDLQRVDQLLVSRNTGQDEYRFSVTRQNENKLFRKLLSWDTAHIDNKKFIIALSAPDTEIVGPIEGLRQQGILLAVFLSLGLVTVTILFYRNTNKALIKATQKLEDEVSLRTRSLDLIEQSYRETVENAGIGFFRTTPDGNFLMANPYLVKMNNCQSEEELIRTARYNEDNWYVEKDRRKEFRRHIEENGYVEGFVSEIKAYSDQEEKWISETARAVKDDEGNIAYYEGTAQDVTHLIRAKEAQRKSDANLRAHIAAMPDLGIIFSINGKVVNIYGDQSLLAKRREDMIGESLFSIAPENIAEDWMVLIDQTVSSGLVQSIEYQMVIGENDRFFEARSALIKEVENVPAKVVILIRDITQRHLDKQTMLTALENADIANRSKTEFLANMSHELRTPLNAILGYSEIMDKELFGPLGNDKYQEYIADIHTSGSHLLDIINDILDLSKIEAGSYNLDETDVKLRKIIEETDRIICGTAENKGITYDSLEIVDLSIRVDSRALKQILINVLSNAFKFTPKGGAVNLSAVIDDTGDLLLVVKDSGVGMNDADIPRILEPFVRIGTHLTTEVSGTGIGLSITKRLIEFHQGTLAIESSPGQGTKVTVTLPAERILQA